MRPSYQTLLGSAAVPINGTWVPLSYNVQNFNATIAGVMWGGAGMTWELQFTLDDVVFERTVTGSQTGTTITVQDAGGPAPGVPWLGPGEPGVGHGLAVGDSVILKGFGQGMDGTYDIASVPNNLSYTVTAASSLSASAAAGARVTPLRVWVHPTLNAVTGARTFAPIGASLPPTIAPTIVMAVRPRILAWTAGNLDFTVLHAGMA